MRDSGESGKCKTQDADSALNYQSFCHDIDSAFVCSHHFCLSVSSFLGAIFVLRACGRRRRSICPRLWAWRMVDRRPSSPLLRLDKIPYILLGTVFASGPDYTPCCRTDLMNYLLCYPSSWLMFMWVAYFFARRNLSMICGERISFYILSVKKLCSLLDNACGLCVLIFIREKKVLSYEVNGMTAIFNYE